MNAIASHARHSTAQHTTCNCAFISVYVVFCLSSERCGISPNGLVMWNDGVESQLMATFCFDIRNNIFACALLDIRDSGKYECLCLIL